ncbi:MAG: hypothetical protein AB1758_05575 [Candidatus Eremiobacterota bacterium]
MTLNPGKDLRGLPKDFFQRVFNGGDSVVEAVSSTRVARLVNSKGEVYHLHVDFLARCGASVPGGSLPASAALAVAHLPTLPESGDPVTLTEDSQGIFRNTSTGRFFQGKPVRLVSTRGRLATVETAGKSMLLDIEHLKRLPLDPDVASSVGAMLSPGLSGASLRVDCERRRVQIGQVTLKMRRKGA